MKTVVVTEGIDVKEEVQYVLDIQQTKINKCCGCWSCWLKTPGRCLSKELDEFYHHYITSERVIYLVKVRQGFVSSLLKTLFERMIPLYLPYVCIGHDGVRHRPRYEHYPEVVFYYEGNFDSERERQVFENYINRVFDQFYSKLIAIKPISEYGKEKR